MRLWTTTALPRRLSSFGWDVFVGSATRLWPAPAAGPRTVKATGGDEVLRRLLWPILALFYYKLCVRVLGVRLRILLRVWGDPFGAFAYGPSSQVGTSICGRVNMLQPFVGAMSGERGRVSQSVLSEEINLPHVFETGMTPLLLILPYYIT